MTRVQFLNDLYSRLGALPKAQAEEWLVYYAEMLADRMEEGMSEEQAVASMEDIDTIASRILQEAGLPPVFVQPPSYPSPPPMTSGAARAYQPPKKRNSALYTVLWIAAAAAVVFAVVRWTNRAVVTETFVSSNEAETATDFGLVEEIPTAPSIDLSGDDVMVMWQSTTDLITGAVYEITELSPDGGERIWRLESADLMGVRLVVHWPADGGVTVLGGSESLWFSSTGDVTYTARDGSLIVTAGEDATDLTVHVPYCMEDVEVTTDSAWVMAAGDSFSSLSVETDSGGVELERVSTDELEISTHSGSVNGSLAYLWQGEVSTRSGDISLTVDVADEIGLETESGGVNLSLADYTASRVDLETESGDIGLYMPEGAGFDLRWKTESGEIFTGSLALSQRSGGRYECGDGSIRINAETDSGDLVLVGDSSLNQD